MAVSFFTEEVKYKLTDKRRRISLVRTVIVSEGFLEGEINIIACSDEYLLTINKKFLSKDYYTDIITFNYSEGKRISGDLFISIERIKENAEKLLVDEENELNRVIVHGVLHLCGYLDSNYEEQKLMRKKEDFYLLTLI